MSLAINLVTRGRPERFVETAETALSGCCLSSTRLMVSVDEDDALSVAALDRLPRDPRIVRSIRPREDALGEKYNRVLELDASLYTHMSDYAPCVTPGWDAKMLEAAAFWPDGIGVVFSNYVNYSFAGIYGVTKGLADKLGWFFPPYFPYWFVDHWIDDIAKLIGRVAFADVTIETPGGKPGTQELRDLPFWTRFFDAGKFFRRQQAFDIINSPEFLTPEWEKAVLLNRYKIVEFKSRFVSDSAREIAAEFELPPDAPPPEPRYLRLRSRAAEMMAEWAKQAEKSL